MLGIGFSTRQCSYYMAALIRVDITNIWIVMLLGRWLIHIVLFYCMWGDNAHRREREREREKLAQEAKEKRNP